MELAQAFTPPHSGALGITIEEIEQERCVTAMPFNPAFVTMGDVVHGGVISALADMAVTVAAWADDEVPESAAGSTVSLTGSPILRGRSWRTGSAPTPWGRTG